MTLPDFSVLLLAWDEADPSVAVLGGSALPPTLSLVYQLAAQHPVLALYPHLPAETPVAVPLAQPAPASQPSKTAPTPPAETLATASSAALAAAAAVATEAPAAAPPATDVLTSATASAGVRLLPGTSLPSPAALPVGSSRVVGLEDLPSTSTPPRWPAASSTLFTAVPKIPATVSPRSQWPAGTPVSASGRWVAPAAPYAGADAPAFAATPEPLQTLAAPAQAPETVAVHPPPPPAPPRPTSHISALPPTLHPLAGDLRFDPDPELPAVQRPSVFTEATEELGTAEAAALSAPEDDLTPEEAPAHPEPAAAPVPAPLAAAEVAPVAAKPTLSEHAPSLKGLNLRMIEYARRAARLVRGRPDFGVIYAPNWPGWLAALEVRNNTGQPLVLYATGLASQFAGPAERGWLLEVERMALRKAQLVLVPTETVRQQLRAHYGATIADVRVVAADDEVAVQEVLRAVAKPALGKALGTSPQPAAVPVTPAASPRVARRA